MCGRFANTKDLQRLISRFKFVVDEDVEMMPRYNIAPSQDVPVIVEDQSSSDKTRLLKFMRWGLVPFWADDPKIGFKMINARSDKVEKSGAFKHSFTHRRCLVPADGFFEWEKRGRNKIPYLFRLKGGEPFAFAGLWDRWESRGNSNSTLNGIELHSFTIITTNSNSIVGKVHDRMPVILSQENEDAWLDSSVNSHTELLSMLVPYPADEMESFEVSPIVNKPSNDIPSCVQPSETQGQGELF